jgi:hypothetical protein
MERGTGKDENRTEASQDTSGANHKSASATQVSTQTLYLTNVIIARSKNSFVLFLFLEKGFEVDDNKCDCSKSSQTVRFVLFSCAFPQDLPKSRCV